LRPCTPASLATIPRRPVAYRDACASDSLILSLCDMQSLVKARGTVSPLSRCARFSSAYATNSLRPHQPRIGRWVTTTTQSRTSLLPPFHQTKHMGGGPKYPSPFSTMHRAPAAMVTKPVDVEIRTPRDPNTLSNYHNYVVRHTSLDFEIDFENKRLVGGAVLRVESLVDEEVDLVLDSRCVYYH
jgi:hypothetical protein